MAAVSAGFGRLAAGEDQAMDLPQVDLPDRLVRAGQGAHESQRVDVVDGFE